MTTHVGFIGLGKMGRPMAERLLDASYPLHAFNRSSGVLEEMARCGAQVRSDAADVARCAEIVLTCLPSEEAVTQVYADLARTARSGQIFADHSTVSIELTRHCAAQVANQGAAFLDAPVSGGPEGARAGTLTVMVGGEQAVFERALPVFQAYGSIIRLCRPVGLGQTVKVVSQLLTSRPPSTELDCRSLPLPH